MNRYLTHFNRTKVTRFSLLVCLSHIICKMISSKYYCISCILSRIEIFIYFLLLLPGIVECKCSNFASSSGYFEEGRVVSGHMPLIAGPQMCADLCNQNSECHVINFNKDILFCELRSFPDAAFMPNIIEDSGTYSMFIKPENVSKYTFRHCFVPKYWKFKFHYLHLTSFE